MDQIQQAIELTKQSLKDRIKETQAMIDRIVQTDHGSMENTMRAQDQIDWLVTSRKNLEQQLLKL